MFRAYVLIIRRSKLYYTASGIITPIGVLETYRCYDTRRCVKQFWPPDDEHMCSKHVEAWNKLVVKQKFCASSWLITVINKLRAEFQQNLWSGVWQCFSTLELSRCVFGVYIAGYAYCLVAQMLKFVIVAHFFVTWISQYSASNEISLHFQIHSLHSLPYYDRSTASSKATSTQSAI